MATLDWSAMSLSLYEETRDRFRGKILDFQHDTTPEVLVEGALSSGKTIGAIWKQLEKLKAHPGMWAFATRWTENGVNSLLRPEYERVAGLHGTELRWNSREKYYALENGCRVFAFHLHTTEIDPVKRFRKIRGLPVSDILVDQAEELEPDFPVEIRRRLRPDIVATVTGKQFPTQLVLLANPVKHYHWLAKQFPEDNSIPSRRYYSLSLFDNAHNLPESMILQALIDCPKTDHRYRELILGRRPEIIDHSKTAKKPFPPDSAGALFEQAKREAREMAYAL